MQTNEITAVQLSTINKLMSTVNKLLSNVNKLLSTVNKLLSTVNKRNTSAHCMSTNLTSYSSNFSFATQNFLHLFHIQYVCITNGPANYYCTSSLEKCNYFQSRISNVRRIAYLVTPIFMNLVPLPAVTLLLCGAHLHCACGAQGVLPCNGWRVTASQLDLPSLTPLSVAGCSRLQLGFASSGTSVIPWVAA